MTDSYIDRLLSRLLKCYLKIMYQPIRVFCFHQVSRTLNALTMWECDWTEIGQFKNNILALKQEYQFIPLIEAYTHLRKDLFRKKKYAVLTCDDGYASVKNIMSWLEKEEIPLTLFINSKYLDGRSWSPLNEDLAHKKASAANMHDVVNGLYLTEKELWNITSPYVTIGLHGYEHLNAVSMSEDEFRDNVRLCKSDLERHPRYIPYFAYTWGQHNLNTDKFLDEMGLLKVTVSGQKNYTYNGFIDRECIDGLSL